MNTNGVNYIYLAIRRPNKPATNSTQVYNAITRSGNGNATTVTGVGFAPDTVFSATRSNNDENPWFDRLRGPTYWLKPYTTSAETVKADSLIGFDEMDGYKLGADATQAYINYSGRSYVNYALRRSPGVFDTVTYT